MTIGKKLKAALDGDFIAAKPTIGLTPGKMIRILREKNNLSQNDLAEATGLTQPTISSLENEKITLGIERAKTLARVLRVHPASLIFSDWNENIAA
ncbi:MAG: helix-turn-helix transcriptional regulator [Bacteriovoracales bacterium]|nr:helix-turn-helix transcriptional regulator [Bacteriovoracales bacterium]